MDEEAQRSRIHRYLEAYNRMDIDGMLAELANHVRFENYSGGKRTSKTKGAKNFRSLALESRSLFLERRQYLKSLVRQGDYWIAQIKFEAELTEEAARRNSGVRDLQLNGESRFRFDGGYISEIIDSSD